MLICPQKPTQQYLNATQALTQYVARVNPTGTDYGFDRDMQIEQELCNMNEYLMNEDFLDDTDFEMPPSLGITSSNSTAGSD